MHIAKLQLAFDLQKELTRVDLALRANNFNVTYKTSESINFAKSDNNPTPTEADKLLAEARKTVNLTIEDALTKYRESILNELFDLGIEQD